jgi:hypothetical protein
MVYFRPVFPRDKILVKTLLSIQKEPLVFSSSVTHVLKQLEAMALEDLLFNISFENLFSFN